MEETMISRSEQKSRMKPAAQKGNSSRLGWSGGLAPLALIGAFVLLGAGVMPAHATPFAYITNSHSNDVSVIDTATNTVVATVPVGGNPYGVAVDPDGTRVYTVNIGGEPGVCTSQPGSVSVIDTATNTVVATVTVGLLPVTAAVHPDGTRVYVANACSDTVSVIDTASNIVMAIIPVGRAPEGVSVNPTGTRVYVPNAGSNDVSVIDTATNTVVATVPVGIHPVSGAVNPDGTRVYIPNFFASNNVSVIDTATNTVIATVPVGRGPEGIAVHPDGTRVYVANYVGNTVSVIDAASNSVIATVPVGVNAEGVSVLPDGTRVYVANFGSNTVSVIDTATNSVIATIPVGIGPRAVGQFIAPGSQTQAQCNPAVASAISSLQDNFRQIFANPKFVVPGATPLEQLQNIIQAVLHLNKGRKMGVYTNLGGVP
jgi:YVTN family beta-propeller protein